LAAKRDVESTAFAFFQCQSVPGIASCVKNIIKALAFLDCVVDRLAPEDIIAVAAPSQECKQPLIAETLSSIGYFLFSASLYLFHSYLCQSGGFLALTAFSCFSNIPPEQVASEPASPLTH
jgi:hypothetical protein